MEFTLKLKINNQEGLIARVALLMERRGFSISFLSIGVDNYLGSKEMTIVIEGEEAKIEQIIKQLEKLIDVIEVNQEADVSMVSSEVYKKAV